MCVIIYIYDNLDMWRVSMSLDLKTLKAKFINGKSNDLDTIIKDAYRDLQLRTIKGHNPSMLQLNG